MFGLNLSPVQPCMTETMAPMSESFIEGIHPAVMETEVRAADAGDDHSNHPILDSLLRLLPATSTIMAITQERTKSLEVPSPLSEPILPLHQRIAKTLAQSRTAPAPGVGLPWLITRFGCLCEPSFSKCHFDATSTHYENSRAAV